MNPNPADECPRCFKDAMDAYGQVCTCARPCGDTCCCYTSGADRKGHAVTKTDDWEQRAQQAGRLLRNLAMDALQRGDTHEYRHLRAAITAGNSQNCDNGRNCHLDHADATTQTPDKPTNTPGPLITPRQAADTYGVTTEVVAYWADTGYLTCIRTPGGHRRYLQREVDAWLAGATRQTVSPAVTVDLLAPVEDVAAVIDAPDA